VETQIKARRFRIVLVLALKNIMEAINEIGFDSFQAKIRIEFLFFLYFFNIVSGW
jgi:hypothetical protein